MATKPALSPQAIRKLPSHQPIGMTDFQGTIVELHAILYQLEEQYGPNSVIYFDAGYNNVVGRVVPQATLVEAEGIPPEVKPLSHTERMQIKKDKTRLRNLLAKYGMPGDHEQS